MNIEEFNNPFRNLSQQEIDLFLMRNGFSRWRQLESGEYIGLRSLMFTWAVCMDIRIDQVFSYRWCFKDKDEAIYFFDTAKEIDEVPSLRTSLKGHRYIDKPLLVEKDELGFDKW